MSLALYRKYRPATFAELKGQEHVAEPLQQALRNGRINHAYLFSGPRGCGKTSSARILARSLNCELGPTPDPCGKCDSCVGLGPGGNGHIDVIEIDAASHGGIDDARDLRERAFFAPVSARFKVYIIDEAHMVTAGGFNALLKLVEEPPPHLKFVFATTEPEKVIGTIRSRTHHYPFRLVPPGTLRELVEEILGSEGVAYEPTALPLVVRAGAGSARDTLSILDQLLAGADDTGITYARAVSLLGYTDSSLLDEVVDAFAARDGAAVFAAIDRVVESGQDPRRFAADLLERFRDLVILSNVPEAGSSGLLDVPGDELERMQRQVTGLGSAELARAADLLHTGLTEMRGATSPRLVLELVCARILLPAAYQDEASMLARLERLERQAALGGGGAFAGGVAAAGDAGAGAAAATGRVASGPVAGGAPASGGHHSASAYPGGGQPSGGPSAGAYPGVGQQPGGRPAGGHPAGTYPAGEQPAGGQSAGAYPGGDGPGAGASGTGGGPQPGGSRAAASRGGASEPSAGDSARSFGPSDRSADAAGTFGQDTGARDAYAHAAQARHPGAAGSGRGPDAASSVGRGAAGPGVEGRSVDNRPGSAQPVATAARPAGGGPDVATVRRAWPDIVEAVKHKSRVAWMAVMSGVQPVSLEGNLLTLSFEAEGARTNFTNGGRDAVLREVFKEYLGVEWRIDTVLAGAGPAPASPSAPRAAAPSYAPASPAPPPQPPSAPSVPAQPRPTPQARPAYEPPPSMPSAPPPPDEPPPPLPPPPGEPVDESDEVDPEGDADVDGNEAEMSGMALIQRELGGQIIREIDNS